MKHILDWSVVNVITRFRSFVDDTFEKVARSRVRLIGLHSETQFRNAKRQKCENRWSYDRIRSCVQKKWIKKSLSSLISSKSVVIVS
jgi:hypothetical protein